MNDEFLHRLRRPPPAAFAARLRARLESQAVARRFRSRHITLYALIACLLGGTALALVSPAVRTVASSVVQRMLPESVVSALQSRLEAQMVATVPTARSAAPAPSSTSETDGLVDSRGPTASSNQAQRLAMSLMPQQHANYVGGSVRAAPAPVMQSAPAKVLVRIEGARGAASALSSVRQAFQNDRSRSMHVSLDLQVSDSAKALRKLCSGQLDIAVTSRPVSAAESQYCQRNRAAFIELPIGYEALAIVVNSANTWADVIRPADAFTLFDPRSQGLTISWNQLQGAWPAAPISLAAPRAGQGFQEFFFELLSDSDASVGERETAARAAVNRQDITLQRDEAGLSAYVRRSVNGLTYVPLATFLMTRGADPQDSTAPLLRALPVLNSRGQAVLPRRETVLDRSYEPLSRTLFAYVRVDTSDAAAGFMQFFLSSAAQQLERSRYIALVPGDYSLASRVLRERWGVMAAGYVADVGDARSAREILLSSVPERFREQVKAQLERAEARDQAWQRNR